MLREFLSLYKRHVRMCIEDLLSVLGNATVDLIFPMVVSYMIDEVIPSRNLDLLIKLSVITAFGYLLKYFFGYMVTFIGHKMGVAIETDLRKQLFDHYESLSFSFFDRANTGEIISRTTNDLFDITEFAHHGPEDLIHGVYILVFSFIVLIRTNLLLTAVIFAIIPIVTFSIIRTNTKWEEAEMGEKEAKARTSATVTDTFSGIRVVKAFTNEDIQSEKMIGDCENYTKYRTITFSYMAKFVSQIVFYMNILKLVSVFLGGYLIYLGRMSVGSLVSFYMYIGLFQEPIMSFTGLVEDFQKTKTGFKRYCEIMHTEPEIKDRPDAVDCADLSGSIDINSVSFSYDSEGEVLKDFDLHVSPGESVAVVGPSGAGKTTLCSLIPRFYDVTEGSVMIDGRDIREYKVKSLRDRVGIVQQDVFLFNGTIRDNILYGRPDATEEEMKRAAAFANLSGFIESLPDGYDTEVGERGVRLSGGQKQRISIARIFLKNPPILILDEATSSLDNENEKIIQESFNALSENRTTLVIAHRLQTISGIKRIVVVKDGKIAEEGDHETLMKKNGVYAALYSAQKTEQGD